MNYKAHFKRYWMGYVWAVIILFWICWFAFLHIESQKKGFSPGNYSEYTCEDCDLPANGGRNYVDSSWIDYYCATHYKEHAEWRSEHKDKVKCQFCDRWFDETSSNGKSISRTNMCQNCTSNYKALDDAFD